MAHDLRPFRNYSEHDVVNLFSYSGDSTLVKKGVAVKVVGDGFAPEANTSPVEFLGNVGASFPNSQSQRFGVKSKVALAGSGDAILGLTLLDIRETDENGEKLVFNPRKAAEMNVVVSGQAVPVLTKGVILYSGDAIANATVGQYAVVSGTAGELANTSTLRPNEVSLGRFLGRAVNGTALIKLNL